MSIEHNEQQTAAAQEPIGYRWRHSASEAWQYSNFPCGWEHQPLYAAPVTAAPAMLNLANGVQLPLVADETGYRIDPAYAQESTPTAPAAVDPVAAYERELAAGATHEHALHAICTPAAPGIDMHAPCTEAVYVMARKLLWIAYVWNDHNFDNPYKVAREMAQEFGIESFDQANAWLAEQAKLIDASPKGGSEARALLGALVSLVAVARRYLPDYDEHPEVQKADDAIDAAMQAQANSHGAGVDK